MKMQPSMSKSSSVLGEDPEQLSPALVELNEKPLHEQGAFWRATAARLAPYAIGKSTQAAEDYDLLGRYFNGTELGLNFIFDKTMGSDGVKGSKFLDEEALAQVFVFHFGFLANCEQWEDALQLEDFLSLCRTLGAHDGAKASPKSVRYAVRRLRIGAMLHIGLEQQNLFHYNYDDQCVSGSFREPLVGGTSVKGRRRGTIRLGDDDTPQVQPQTSMMSQGILDSSDDLNRQIYEYLFCDPKDWPGKVHWLHAHRPTRMMILALGQQHHLRIHAQGVLSRLEANHPQHNFGSAEASVKSGSRGWFLMTFPAVVLDHLARQSLQNFKKWETAAMTQARRNGEVDEPPPVHVGVVSYPAALAWTGPNSVNAVMSVSGDVEYVGKWTNEVESSSFICRLYSTSCCQRRKRSPDGYEPLPQDDVKDLVHSESSAMDAITLAVADDQAEQEASFEHIFEDILLLLAEKNSLLRMGTHLQLVCRILLTWTSSYVEVVELYKAAIARLQHQLGQKDHPDKEILIGKISGAMREISDLLRSLDPFMQYVLPDFHTQISGADKGDPHDLSQVIRMHHLVDTENNLRQVMHGLEAQRNLCDSIIGEYDRKNADKVNSILNFLTMISFLVMPLQIFTGIYGMNFEVIPELKWKYGYPHYFLWASFIGTLVFATFLCIYRSMI